MSGAFDGDLKAEEFTIGDLIGKGSTGTLCVILGSVYKGLCRGLEVAIKQYATDKARAAEISAEFVTECAILRLASL